MDLRFDHIVVLTKDLAEGEAWLESMLGVPAGGGGRHSMMGTHNRLWGLGSSYLELLAIDPEGDPPDRPRWFGLDDPKIMQRLASGPYLATWAVSTSDLPGLLTQAPAGWGAAERFARDDLAWQVSIPNGPEMPLDGAWPLMIQWMFGLHPAERLGDQGLALEELVISGANSITVAEVFVALGRPIRFDPGSGDTQLTARLSTPSGPITL
ncbi:MAG: VOC family protein [Pseudomonadota bacterium]